MLNLDLPDRTFGGYIFDCDGTLTDNMPVHYRAWSRAMEDFGGAYPETLFYAWGGRPTTMIVPLLNEKFGFSLKVEEVVRRKEDYYLKMLGEIEPLDEVMAVVRRMHGLAPLAVASGGHRELVEATLDMLGIRGLFDAIICAEDYEQGKPSPEPFLLAARELGVEAESCIVFEDSPLGIEAAQAAGMAWVYVPNPLERAAGE
jgi:HAD superfamily hydrolase (TIGR01509 family)